MIILEVIPVNKVAIYCRVDSGCNSASLQHAAALQKVRLEQFAATKKYIVVGYYDDIGYAGHDISRPGLLALNTDYDKGLFDAVLVVNHSRLYRGYAWSKPNWPFPVITLADA